MIERRRDGIYVIFAHNETVGPFATYAKVIEFLNWLESKK